MKQIARSLGRLVGKIIRFLEKWFGLNPKTIENIRIANTPVRYPRNPRHFLNGLVMKNSWKRR